METIIERFGESRIHLIEIDGQKLINAADCAKALDYKNYRSAIYQFIETNKELLETCVCKIRTQSRGDRQSREQWFFNEKGLIAFLIKTNQPKAFKFQKWALDILATEVKKVVNSEYSTLRKKTKKIRVEFTDVLKDRGYEKRHEYIQTTYLMKTTLGIDKNRPKNDLSVWELCKVAMSEILSTARPSGSEAEGYKECIPIIYDSTKDISYIPEKHDNIESLSKG